MSDDYLWDRSGPEDPEIAKLEQLLAPLAHTEVRPRRRRRYWIAASVVLAAAAVIAAIAWPRGSTCDGDGVRLGARETCLAIGATLDTEDATAELAIANVGTAQLGAHTRVRLDRAVADHHQLYLEQGTLHAKVTAPPRLFLVSTPSTPVTDLGCEYAIAMAPTGEGAIEVQGGKVELDVVGGVVIAPAGTHCAIHPARRPGFPVAATASEAFTAAVADYERGVAGALDRVLASATASDAITLINIAVIEPGLPSVLRRLGEIAAVPAGITVDDAVKNTTDRSMWREAVVNAQVEIDGMLRR